MLPETMTLGGRCGLGSVPMRGVQSVPLQGEYLSAICLQYCGDEVAGSKCSE
jgi:hypothetical protein